MLYIVFLTLHILIAILLMAVVLLQPGKGGAMSASFGGGGNQTLFGGRGATTFLAKATWFLGAGFMITSLILALAIGRRDTAMQQQRSLLRENPIEAPAAAPPAAGEPSGTSAPAGSGSGN